MTEQLDGQVGWFDQDTWSGKTYPEPSAAAEAKTSKPSLKKSSGSSKKTSPICLMLSKGDGQKPGASTTNWAPGALLGAYTTHSFGESPREENVSRLSQILEDSPHPKYSLSAKACQGILNRAERRGKKLPDELLKALTLQSASKETESTELTPQAATEPDGAGGGVTPLTQSTDRQSSTVAELRKQSVSRSEPENLGGGKGILIQTERTGALSTFNNQSVLGGGIHGGQGSKAGGIAYSEDVSPSLKSVQSGGNTVPDVMCAAVDCRNGRENPCVNGTLQSKEQGYNMNSNNVIRVFSS